MPTVTARPPHGLVPASTDRSGSLKVEPLQLPLRTSARRMIREVHVPAPPDDLIVLREHGAISTATCDERAANRAVGGSRGVKPSCQPDLTRLRAAARSSAASKVSNSYESSCLTPLI